MLGHFLRNLSFLAPLTLSVGLPLALGTAWADDYFSSQERVQGTSPFSTSKRSAQTGTSTRKLPRPQDSTQKDIVRIQRSAPARSREAQLRYEYRNRPYELDRPQVGWQTTVGMKSRINQRFDKGPDQHLDMILYSMALEYQPEFIQRFGVLGIGIMGGFTQTETYNSTGPALKSLWLWGGQVRYQARFFGNQFIVPQVGYSYVQYQYKTNVGSGAFGTHGPMAGLWFYLNSIDKDSARSAYQKFGLSRTYLVAEVRRVHGGNNRFYVNDTTYNLGLRFEF